MDAYTGFAQVYDLFMEDVPYDCWCRQNVSVLKEYGIRKGIVADLGCGTGNITERMAGLGYDMIGIDSSEEMLEIAQEKNLKNGNHVLYLCQDMRSFELYGTCAAVISRCDAMNYILTKEDLISVFRLVNNYLDPGGIFLFDCNSVHKYETVLSDNTIAENRENASFIWENYYDPKTHRNEYDLTLFILDEERKEDEKRRFLRLMETHVQRAFTLDEIKEAAKKAGMIWREARDTETMSAADQNTGRYLIILQENGKHSKKSK